MSTTPDTSVLSDANCSDHVTDVREEEVAETIASRQWCYCEAGGGQPCNSYCDTYGAALYRLIDGRYAIAVESSDTSGHG